MQIWRSFLRLSDFERAAVLQAAAGLTATWVGLRLAGFRRWKALLERIAQESARHFAIENVANAGAGREIARMQAAAVRHLPFKTNCLEQSLVLWWLMRRQGLAAELRIGGRKVVDRFEAHAWVEFEGSVLSDWSEEHLHFVPFDGSVNSMEIQAQ